MLEVQRRNLVLLGEVPDDLSGQRQRDLESVGDGRQRDQLHLGNVLLYFFELLGVDQHVEVRLLGDLALRPLFLGALARGRGGSCDGILRFLLTHSRLFAHALLNYADL